MIRDRLVVYLGFQNGSPSPSGSSRRHFPSDHNVQGRYALPPSGKSTRSWTIVSSSVTRFQNSQMVESVPITSSSMLASLAPIERGHSGLVVATLTASSTSLVGLMSSGTSPPSTARIVIAPSAATRITYLSRE